LIPQSARFYQSISLTQDQSTTAVLSPRDGEGALTHRSTNVDNIPSGPRIQPQPNYPRDANQYEPRPSRIPPSGPSSAPKTRGRYDSMPVVNELPAPRNHGAMDVDSPSLQRDSGRMNEISIRAGSGMYADRESGSDLPKAPRAMASKVSASSSFTSPLAPIMMPPRGLRTTSGYERPPRPRDHSPPPQVGDHESWDRFDGTSQRHPNSRGANRRENPQVWRPDARDSEPARNKVCVLCSSFAKLTEIERRIGESNYMSKAELRLCRNVKIFQM
jgi:hypothetical protein